jgi:hypothetical protein
MKRILVLGGLVLALVVGVGAVLLAHDVRSWRDTFENGTLAYTAAPASDVRLTASTDLPSGLAGGILSVGRDRQWLRGLRRFVAAYELTEDKDALGPGDYAVLNSTASSLNKLTQDPDPVRASQAYDLLAVLVFREAYPGSGVNVGQISNAVLNLENAVRLDPGNALAKQNLELALRVAFASHAVIQLPGGLGRRATNKRRGGTGGPPGEGY